MANELQRARASEAGDSQYRRFVGSCFFVVLTVFGAWGLADIVLTARGAAVATATPEFEHVQGLGLGPRRNVHGLDVTTDDYGFRRTSTPARADGEFRILVVGDSVAFGTGLRNGEDWPSQLESNLRAAGFPVTVLNAALPGQTAEYMRRAARYFGSKVKPDLIVAQDTGNILALVNGEPDALAHLEQGDAEWVAARVRGWEHSFDSKPEAACFYDKKPAFQTLQPVIAPGAFQYAASHSPVAFEAITLLSRIHPVGRDQAPSASQAVPAPCPGYLTSELVILARLAREARGRGIPVAVVMPAYAYTWEMVLGLPFDMSPEHHPPAGFVGRPRDMERFLRNLHVLFSQTFEGSSVLLLDPVRTHLQRFSPPRNVFELYLNDYTHFSAHGAATFASAIALQLEQSGMLPRPTAQRPWIHPHERTAASVDLTYRPLPPDIKPLSITAVIFLVTVALGTIGALCLRLGGPNRDGALYAAPALGGFVVLSCQLMGLDVLGRLQAIGALSPGALAIGFAAAAMFVNRGWASYARIGNALLVLLLCALLMAAALSALVERASESDSPAGRAIQTLVAWVDYSGLARESVDTPTLYRRWMSDHVARPITLPSTVANFGTAMELSNPRVATLVSAHLPVPAASAILGMLGAAYLAGMFALVFCFRALAPARGTRRAVLAAAVCIYLALVLWKLPSVVTFYHAAGILVIGLGLGMTTARPFTAAALVLVGAVSLYLLPIVVAWIPMLGVAVAAFAILKRGGSDTRRAMLRAFTLLLVAASARMLVLDRSVGNAEMLRAHDGNHLSLPTYYYH